MISYEVCVEADMPQLHNAYGLQPTSWFDFKEAIKSMSFVMLMEVLRLHLS